MKTAIVILNYNGERHLKTFLPSVIEHCPPDARVYLADNASTDGSVAFAEKAYPELDLIKLTKNHGFAGGYNEALKQIDEEYFALVNSDLEVTEGWLKPLTEILDANETIASVQPKIRSYRERGYFEYAGASGGFIDTHGYAFCRGRIFGKCERDIGQHDDPREVFWTTGACMVIRASAFREAGGFDADLFAHMEEIDLCWRLKNAGHRMYCQPASTVYHLGGGTLSAHSPHKTYLNYRNNLTVLIKNDFRKKFRRKLLKRLVLDGISAMQLLFSKGPAHFTAVLRAHFYLYSNFKSLRAKRRKWKSRAVNINNTGFYRNSVVYDFFVKKKRVFGALEGFSFVRQRRKF